jgi:hypothetical protein
MSTWSRQGGGRRRHCSLRRFRHQLQAPTRSSPSRGRISWAAVNASDRTVEFGIARSCKQSFVAAFRPGSRNPRARTSSARAQKSDGRTCPLVSVRQRSGALAPRSGSRRIAPRALRRTCPTGPASWTDGRVIASPLSKPAKAVDRRRKRDPASDPQFWSFRPGTCQRQLPSEPEVQTGSHHGRIEQGWPTADWQLRGQLADRTVRCSDYRERRGFSRIFRLSLG